MPPKNKIQEDPLTLANKARDHCDTHRLGEAESLLDRADDKGFSKNINVMSTRALWCLRSHRFEEASNLASACIDELVKRLEASPQSPVDNEVLNMSTWILQNMATPDASKKLSQIYEKVLPQYSALGGSNDKTILESAVAVSAFSGEFKQMQKYAQELNKKSYKEPKYTIWMVFAFLMQIQNRRNLTPEEAGANLHYKLALRTLETFVTTQVAAKEKQVAEAAKKQKQQNNNTGKKNKNNNNDSNSNKDDNINAPTITPAVAILFVDVLLSQQKFDEAIDFLLDDAKGKFYGAKSERIRQVGVILRKMKKNTEANSIARHLLFHFDHDRWDFFEDYRDTTMSVVNTTTEDEKDKTTTTACGFSRKAQDGKATLFEAEAGKSTLVELVEDLLQLNKDILAKNGKSRAPRLGVISLLSEHQYFPALLGLKTNKEALRQELITEHVKIVGKTKSVLFFDLVKYVTEKDADLFDEVGAFVLAGYCRRLQMAKSDDETNSFVDKCLEQVVVSSSAATQEDDAVKSDIFIVAAITACLRRHLVIIETDKSSSSPSSSTSSWLFKATSIAAKAVEIYGIDCPHITFLSVLLHQKIGSSDLDSVRALDIKSVQHESIITALQMAIQENHVSLISDLTDSGAARFYKTIHRDCDMLVDKGLKTMSFLAFEEVFETKAKLMKSCSRVEALALDSLLNNVYPAETSGELRATLLMERSELMNSVLRLKDTGAKSTDELISLEDRVNLLAVCLHEEPRSDSFTKLVDYLLPNSSDVNAIKKRAALARAIAAVLITLERISGESSSAKLQKDRLLEQYDIPTDVLLSEETAAAFGGGSSNNKKNVEWISELISLSKNVFQNGKVSNKQQATSGIDKLLTSCAECVKNLASCSEDEDDQRTHYLFFPVIQLMVLTIRVTCDKQNTGVKNFISKFKAVLEELVLAKLEEEVKNKDDEPAKKGAISSSSVTLEDCVKSLSNSLEGKKTAKTKRRIEIVKEAIKMIGVMERMTR